MQVVFLNKRRGFIRMAISAGAPLVPVFIFGQVGQPREGCGETTKTGGEDCCAHLSNGDMLLTYRSPAKLIIALNHQAK